MAHVIVTTLYEGFLESIQPFWISREPFTRPWCILAASQRRPYCPSLNNHSRVRLFSRQWDAFDWACVLCNCRIHNDRESRSTSSRQCTCPFYSSRTAFLAKHRITQVCQPPYSPHLAFPKPKIAIQREDICECDGHTVHKTSQRQLTVDLLAPGKSDCSRMCSKVSSDWQPSYIKVMRPIFEICKMAGYFPDSSRRLISHVTHSQDCHHYNIV